MTNVHTRQSNWILALITAIAIFFASVPMAWASGEIIDQNGTKASLASSAQTDTYTFKVNGKAFTSNVKTVTAILGGAKYNVPFRFKSQTFVLSKKIKLHAPLPESVTIEAVDKSGNKDSIELSIPPILVNEASVKAKKSTFIGKQVYVYEVSGIVVHRNLQSLLLIIGNSEKELDFENGQFKAKLFEHDASTVTIKAVSEDGKEQQIEVKVK